MRDYSDRINPSKIRKELAKFTTATQVSFGQIFNEEQQIILTACERAVVFQITVRDLAWMGMEEFSTRLLQPAIIKLSRRIQEKEVPMRRVIIESPFASTDMTQHLTHTKYLVAALRDSVLRGESPYASHAILAMTGVLDDLDPEQREKGLRAGFAWGHAAHAVAVYDDLGVSPGMTMGIERARAYGLPIEHRQIPGWASTEQPNPRACESCKFWHPRPFQEFSCENKRVQTDFMRMKKDCGLGHPLWSAK